MLLRIEALLAIMIEITWGICVHVTYQATPTQVYSENQRTGPSNLAVLFTTQSLDPTLPIHCASLF